MTRCTRALASCAFATVFLLTACHQSTPVAPTPPPPPPTVAPAVVNTPPTITDIRIAAARVEADHEVEVTATVADAETAVDQLTYSWSATPAGGTFTGSGPAVRWRAPTRQRTPDLYSLALTVTETYRSEGTQKENTVSASVMVHYNDSPTEVNQLAGKFYDNFGTASVGADACVADFTESCPGKAEERAQIQDNRNRSDFRIAGSSLHASPQIGFNNSLSEATFRQACSFTDVNIATGTPVQVNGDCVLTAIYENWRWWLCVSNFIYRTAATTDLRMRVPGRLIQQ